MATNTATHTLEQLVTGEKDGEKGKPPDDGTLVSVKGYPINPMNDSFFLVDSKPGKKASFIVHCKLKESVVNETKERILMYSQLSSYEGTKHLVKQIEVEGSYKGKNNGSNRIFPEVRDAKVTKLY
ncbi:MAG: hypothetical protein JSW73_01420 [Candidatus Woesearchaeota archaeon]|nr:MAG: hypothetical protein JSW73_01420 [Candidatus Woesearchaeota archaeon]